MNRRVGFSRLASLGPCLAVTALLTLGPRLHAEDTPEDYSKGTQVFRLILQKNKLKFTDALTAKDEPKECLIVVLGDPAGLGEDNIPGGLNRFLREGGAVLFASDRQTAVDPLPRYGIQISGEIVACNVPWQTYRGSKWCPYVEPIQDDPTGVFADLLSAPGVGGRKGLATNLTSYLSLDDTRLRIFGWSILANLPAGCSRLGNRGEVIQHFPKELPFAVGGPVRGGDGRLLVLADHSIFINLMMQQTDNGNLQFGFRVASWLNESGKRKKVLFIEDGVPQTDVKLQALPTPPEIPKPSMNALVGKANEFLANLEYYDELNQFLADKFPPRWLIRWLLILLTILLVWYGFVRSRRGRHRVDPSEPLLASAVKRAKPNASAIELRHQSLVDAGNLWEPARFLARQFFEAALGAALVFPAPGRVRLPPFQVMLGGLRGWLLGQRVRRLWRFAHQPLPQPVTIRQFRKLARKVADLKDAVAQGRIRFSSTPQPSVAR
jgi:hypothetical protein